MFADQNVVVADEGREGADSDDDGQGSIAGRHKSQSDDIGFARAPVAVEQSSGALPIDIPWTVRQRVQSGIACYASSPGCPMVTELDEPLPAVTGRDPGRHPPLGAIY